METRQLPDANIGPADRRFVAYVIGVDIHDGLEKKFIRVKVFDAFTDLFSWVKQQVETAFEYIVPQLAETMVDVLNKTASIKELSMHFQSLSKQYKTLGFATGAVEVPPHAKHFPIAFWKTVDKLIVLTAADIPGFSLDQWSSRNLAQFMAFQDFDCTASTIHFDHFTIEKDPERSRKLQIAKRRALHEEARRMILTRRDLETAMHNMYKIHERRKRRRETLGDVEESSTFQPKRQAPRLFLQQRSPDSMESGDDSEIMESGEDDPIYGFYAHDYFPYSF
mmetsp:Transcript_20001/g.39308  ORF Transcript_20001/g.39308 Transcript_20001/m.39308 type:complete len:280 (-) Transcript_20001:459-1298(-)|eukprot:CAMPEP_0171501130 /NCGR_PEP_ID=MMETSP0958-20121227/9389_1 /TAXON_ID=87120 /ORGANISM="Aurantiochytrium limacinum, Strain ATCCMYA-1381" /LENGTH=279 /DNA_ID=CAMNT_0012035915 /DNA_START=1012 /DNA_END=1851 /DNA_ORIENTATION=-